MSSYSKHDVILVRYPFSDGSSSKVRPAVIVSTSHPSQDVFLTPLTSKTSSLWETAGLNVPTAVKRGVYTVHERLLIQGIGRLAQVDAQQLEQSLQTWFGW